MKKIAAFLTALILFAVSVTAFHTIVGESLDTNNSEFGTWISSKKDLSYRAVSSNIEDDTYLMLGSSEFHHGKKSPYHPTAIFRSMGMNVMCIGAAQNQSLTHAITMGAVGNNLKTKKAVLIVSPSWFSKSGTSPEGFAARFSENMYEQMLENDSLSEETKEAISDRVEELLEISPKALDSAKRARRILLKGSAGFKDKVYFSTNRWINDEKESVSAGLMWKSTGLKNYEKYTKTNEGSEPDWDRMAEQADEEFAENMTNDFYMKDSLYSKKVVPMMDERKGADKTRTYANSPEYGDLRLFLDVCREEGIEVMMIMLPVNGYWYDYTGFKKENRETFSTEVTKVAEEYGIKTCNFFDQCYTPGFLEDIVHPAGKGWVRINEAAYRFFKGDNKDI